MTLFRHSSIFICVFLFSVFICDSLAWFFGMLFGKNNRGRVACSPNKSIAGFIGGYAGSIAAGIVAHLLWTDIFTGSILKGIALGFAVATAGITGDLIESVFKRSAGVKHYSGTRRYLGFNRFDFNRRSCLLHFNLYPVQAAYIKNRAEAC